MARAFLACAPWALAALLATRGQSEPIVTIDAVYGDPVSGASIQIVGHIREARDAEDPIRRVEVFLDAELVAALLVQNADSKGTGPRSAPQDPPEARADRWSIRGPLDVSPGKHPLSVVAYTRSGRVHAGSVRERWRMLEVRERSTVTARHLVLIAATIPGLALLAPAMALALRGRGLHASLPLTKRAALLVSRPDLVGAWLAVVLGAAFAFLTPPFQVPDEFAHFARAYQIAHRGSGAADSHAFDIRIPQSFRAAESLFIPLRYSPDSRVSPATLRHALDIRSASPEPRSTLRTPAAAYSPVAYLPQVLAHRLGMFSSRPVAQLYAMRLLNLLLYAAMLALALKRMPFGKRILLAVGLLPMSIHQAASASPDAFTNAAAFLALAMLSGIAIRGEYSLREFLAVVALAIGTALSKQIYLFLFLIPVRSITSRNRARTARMAGLMFASFGSAAAALAARSITAGSTLELLSWPLGAANALQQISVLSSDPVVFLKAAWETVQVQSPFYAESMIGWLGWADTELPNALIAICWIGLLFLGLTDDQYPELPDLRFKGLLLLIAAAVLAALLCIAFVAWTPSGSELVGGIQGRYLIPILPLVLLALNGRWIATKPRGVGYDAALAVAVAAILTWSLIATVTRYYV